MRQTNRVKANAYVCMKDINQQTFASSTSTTESGFVILFLFNMFFWKNSAMISKKFPKGWRVAGGELYPQQLGMNH